MSDAARRAKHVLAYLKEQRPRMVDMLVELSSMESPTDDAESQRAVQQRLTEVLARLGFSVRRRSGRELGGVLYAAPVRRVPNRPAQLLIGHSDTVWPRGTLESMPVEVEDGVVRGPGTFDMKAGLVQGIFALEALNELGHEPPLTPVWLINSDEEIGSPESRPWVEKLARRVQRTLVLEPALGPEGHLKTARKGVGRYHVAIHGKAAHAGLDPRGGASAIQELSDVIRSVHALTDFDRGITVNVGVVEGGSRPNVIAASAHARIDVRFLTLEEGQEVDRAIQGLVPATPGTTLEVTGGIETPPLERTPRNRELWRAAQAAAERLGIELSEEVSGGGSDGNTTSQYTATLDGLGAVGDGAHAHHEHVVVEKMPERAALVAELLMHTPGDPL